MFWWSKVSGIYLAIFYRKSEEGVCIGNQGVFYSIILIDFGPTHDKKVHFHAARLKHL